ncbi:MAG: type IV pilin protein [Pseudomonadota bacterium]
MTKSKHQTGVTLIELLIVVAIVAILASLIIPSYQDSLRKARRADGQSVMLELSQWMERFYTENGRFDQDRAGAGVAASIPAELLSAPKGANTAFYNLAVANLTRETFTITATAVAAQAGDKCGNLTLTQTGAKGMSASGFSIDQCWQ